jgi:hypothetical protein
MPVFVTPFYTQIQNSSPKLTKKIPVRPQDVSMEFLLSREIGNDYKVEFLIQLNLGPQRQDPSLIVRNSEIDMASLRNSILAKLPPVDRKYMMLKEFSAIKATFHFDYSLWFKDALHNVSPQNILTQFSRTFKFKVPLPSMILKDAIRVGFPDFLIRKFKKYIEVKQEGKGWFKNLFPTITKMVSTKIPERFDYTYNYQTNSMILNLKTMWIMALVYAVGEFSKIAKERKLEKKIENPGNFFAVKVKQQIPSFDNASLQDFLKKKFL